jgi:hypothetical protein
LATRPALDVKTVLDAKKVLRGTASAIALLLVLVGLFYGCIYVFSKTFKYEQQYNVDAKHVFVDDKPHDCEWDAAPLGNKYCHYENEVTLENDASGAVTDVYVRWVKHSD